MITLYAADTANSSKIFIALEELDLEYQAIPIDILAGDQFDPDFQRINPNSKIPVIIDQDGPNGQPLTIFESGAILLYLAEKHGRLTPASSTDKIEIMQWLMVQIGTVGPMMGQFIHFSSFAPEGNEYALSRYRSQVMRVYDVLEGRLEGRQWFCGDDYSIVDIANFPWVRPIARFFGADITTTYPRLADWVARIETRSAVTRADHRKGQLAERLSTPDAHDPDKIDRLLGRGVYGR